MPRFNRWKDKYRVSKKEQKRREQVIYESTKALAKGPSGGRTAHPLTPEESHEKEKMAVTAGLDAVDTYNAEQNEILQSVGLLPEEEASLMGGGTGSGTLGGGYGKRRKDQSRGHGGTNLTRGQGSTLLTGY